MRLVKKEYIDEELASISILNLVGLIVILAIAGIAIDTSRAIYTQQRLQIAADAAAHAAVVSLPDKTDAITAAIEISKTSMPDESFGNVLSQNDIEFGLWDPIDKEFELSNNNVNAVRVTTRQSDGISKAFRTMLLQLVGSDYWNMSAVSVFSAGECAGNALLTDGEMQFDFNFSVSKTYCLFGETYSMKDEGTRTHIYVGSDATIAAREAAELESLEQMSGNSGVTIDGNLLHVDYKVPFYPKTDCIIGMFKNPSHKIQPNYITNNIVNYITQDQLIMPRIGEDPANPNDGPGPFGGLGRYPSGNGVDDWPAVLEDILACPDGNGDGWNGDNKGKYDKPSTKLPKEKDLEKDEHRAFLDPNTLVRNAINIIQCNPKNHYVVIDSGVELSQMVLISECGWAFCGPGELDNDSGLEEVQNWLYCRANDGSGPPVNPPFLQDVVLLAEGDHKNTIHGKYGLRAGADDNCADGGGVLMISNGSMRVHGYYWMNDVQAIAPDDIHWHQKVVSKGGLTIAGTKIHAMRNWFSEYEGCPNGGNLFLQMKQKILMVE